MKRMTMLFGALALTAASALGQSLEDLDIQFHGYLTQGFLYTTSNNALTTNSSDGSPKWSEAVVNISALPIPKLRVAVQARYELFGNYANGISIDYALADYKADDRFGLRFGKVKIPSALFNENQDIDPSYMWALLPQSVYQTSSRNSQLSAYGGVAYGTLRLSKAGKLEYRGWAGEQVVAADDGYVLPFVEAGLIPTNGASGVISGGAVRWKTPIPGVLVGAADRHSGPLAGPVTAGNGALSGQFATKAYNGPVFFAKYERGKVMATVEQSRLPVKLGFQFPGVPSPQQRLDYRGIYAMATYKASSKLTVGVYDSQFFDRQAALGPARYSKDWTVGCRYDFNAYLYAKAEEHFIDGEAVMYDVDLNPGGLKPTTKMTALKVGVSF